MEEVSLQDNVDVANKILNSTISYPSQETTVVFEGKTSPSNIDEAINAIPLFELLMSNYGTSWIGWLPEVIKKTILNNRSNEIIENKIQALAVCLSTDTPWLEWHIFENVAKAFNHQVPNFGYTEPLSLGECWVTVRTMNYLRQEDWSNEVKIYIATVAFQNNYVYLPRESELEMAQRFLDGFVIYPDLKMQVSQYWDKLRVSQKLDKTDDISILDREFSETPVQIQLSKIAIAKQYLLENTEK